MSSQDELRIFGLELKYHKQNDVEVIIPHIANPIEIGTSNSTAKKTGWNVDTFREKLSELGHGEREAAFDMLEFVQDKSDGFKWGQGQRGSIFFQSSVDGNLVSIFYYYEDGALGIDLDSLSPKFPNEAFEIFVDSLMNIRGFEKVREKTNWQEFQTINTQMDKSARTEFKQAVLALQDSLR